jgi:hypothetical protein
MSILDGIARPYWLPELSRISGPQLKGIGGLICDENYQIYSQITPTSFVLSFTDPEPFLNAFAGDINRIGSASFESALGITKSRALPRSAAWLIIQTYYSAFFSAHALLRMLGESCTPIDREQLNSLTRIGSLFGATSASPMVGGLYHLTCDAKARTISGTALSGSPHEVFWKVFYERVMRLSSEAVTVSTESLGNRQLASGKLYELAENLCFQSSPRGRWLSTVRNAVNYSQKHATWYPYAGQQKYYEQLFEKAGEWSEDPIDLDLGSYGDKDLRRFQVTCNFIVAAFRSLTVDMAGRCTTGRSFHSFGALACLNIASRARL